jgi:hypothetical protein
VAVSAKKACIVLSSSPSALHCLMQLQRPLLLRYRLPRLLKSKRRLLSQLKHQRTISHPLLTAASLRLCKGRAYTSHSDKPPSHQTTNAAAETSDQFARVQTEWGLSPGMPKPLSRSCAIISSALKSLSSDARENWNTLAWWRPKFCSIRRNSFKAAFLRIVLCDVVCFSCGQKAG